MALVLSEEIPAFNPINKSLQTSESSSIVVWFVYILQIQYLDKPRAMGS